MRLAATDVISTYYLLQLTMETKNSENSHITITALDQHNNSTSSGGPVQPPEKLSDTEMQSCRRSTCRKSENQNYGLFVPHLKNASEICKQYSPRESQGILQQKKNRKAQTMCTYVINTRLPCKTQNKKNGKRHELTVAH